MTPVRHCECLMCGHKWTAPVVVSESNQNTSGEKTNWCPKCGTKSVMSSPVVVVEAWDETTEISDAQLRAVFSTLPSGAQFHENTNR